MRDRVTPAPASRQVHLERSISVNSTNSYPRNSKKFDGNEHVLTKSGEREFTFGAQNENEVVFVPGKNGKIDFLFTELYGAKRVDPGKQL